MKQLPSSTWLTDRHGFFIASISFTAQITWLQRAGETIKLLMTITNGFKQFSIPSWCCLCMWFFPDNSWICRHTVSSWFLQSWQQTKLKLSQSTVLDNLNYIYAFFFFFLVICPVFQPRGISNTYVYRDEKKESGNFWILPLILILMVELHNPFG